MTLSHWLALSKAPGVGLRTFHKALEIFGSPPAVFSATADERRRSGIFKKPALDYLAASACLDSAEIQREIEWSKNTQNHIITLTDAHYPDLLKTIADPPPVLYVAGNIECLKIPQIAIVGSRNPTPSGRENAKSFASKLARHGFVITSGFASGIDAEAHIGALAAAGDEQTIAIFGCGLDVIYPSKHKSLAQEIIKRGALVSEFALGSKPIALNFPRRNRVISGLTFGTLVVEAGVRSGTMITARLAAEQGREVFAVPGSIHNPLAGGCHRLIQQGAKLVVSERDILEELPKEWIREKFLTAPKFSKSSQSSKKSSQSSSKETRKNSSVLLKYLDFDARTIDSLVEKSGLSAQTVIHELTILELRAQVVKVGNSGYALTK